MLQCRIVVAGHVTDVAAFYFLYTKRAKMRENKKKQNGGAFSLFVRTKKRPSRGAALRRKMRKNKIQQNRASKGYSEKGKETEREREGEREWEKATKSGRKRERKHVKMSVLD